MPSEALLVAVLAGGVPPAVAVTVATVATCWGRCRSTCWVSGGRAAAEGAWSDGWHAGRRVTRPGWSRPGSGCGRWGAPALLLSWLPVVGDAFVLAAGLVGVRVGPFLLFTTVGKGLRYVFVAVSAMTAL